MRITNKMMTANIKRNVFGQSERLLRSQEILSSGKRINRPSDDPVGIGKVLDYRKTLSSFEQYERNIQQAKNRIEFMETTLEGVEELIVDAKNWAVNQAGSSTADRDAAISSVQNIREQILQLANSKMGRNSIFAGFQTDGPAFDASGGYNGDNGYFSVLTGDAAEMQIEADGSRVFQGTEDVFDALGDLITGLQTDDVALIDTQIDRLIGAQAQVQEVRAESGAHYQQLELSESQMAKLKMTVEELLDRTEKASVEEAIIDLKNQEMAYEIALNTSARIVQPTLMNFLR
ncbi:MAG: flagellar hook-associated protein FlgL [Desulfobacterales bacterium]|nr:flagellar hook-associated protein FlgL [Desulfobacterales bacterium]MDJ0854926.1 flagellar hook-associated protein FlgL [Desulfobacterales bacterium]MDJ0988435.1 flagellar hook-associated protein FlgL [Desulfobacterales bacterium]